MDNCLDIGSNFISIQTWFTTYGHFLDESFNLYDFYSKIKNNKDINFKILQEYPNDKEYYKNYSTISKILFNNNHINAYNFKNNKIIKLKNLYLIKHSYDMPTFHRFPINVRNHILDNILISDIFSTNDSCNNCCFITRGIATHLPRNLDNQNEIESYFKNNSFSIINPEELSFCDFINNIRNKKLIIVTWGSALTNLIFSKPGTNIIILKSKSYEDENLDLFRYIIANLNVVVITHVDNKIDIKEIEKFI